MGTDWKHYAKILEQQASLAGQLAAHSSQCCSALIVHDLDEFYRAVAGQEHGAEQWQRLRHERQEMEGGMSDGDRGLLHSGLDSREIDAAEHAEIDRIVALLRNASNAEADLRRQNHLLATVLAAASQTLRSLSNGYSQLALVPGIMAVGVNGTSISNRT